jgi:hypothetical protein
MTYGTATATATATTTTITITISPIRRTWSATPSAL